MDWGNGLINNRWANQILIEWHLFEMCVIIKNLRNRQACQTLSHTHTHTICCNIPLWSLWKEYINQITIYSPMPFNTCMIPCLKYAKAKWIPRINMNNLIFYFFHQTTAQMYMISKIFLFLKVIVLLHFKIVLSWCWNF